MSRRAVIDGLADTVVEFIEDEIVNCQITEAARNVIRGNIAVAFEEGYDDGHDDGYHMGYSNCLCDTGYEDPIDGA